MNTRILLDAIAIPRARAAHYALPVPTDARRRLAAAWTLLALVSLAMSGVFSVLLVLSRTPGVKDVFPLVDFFHPLQALFTFGKLAAMGHTGDHLGFV